MAVKFGGWDENIHNEVEQVKRIEAAKKLGKDIVEIDKANERLRIKGSATEPYECSLHECTCPDFSIRQGTAPCKHIYCLAFELGLMDGLPIYKKRCDTLNPEEEIEKYKALYITGEISGDVYVRLCTPLQKLIKKK